MLRQECLPYRHNSIGSNTAIGVGSHLPLLEAMSNSMFYGKMCTQRLGAEIFIGNIDINADLQDFFEFVQDASEGQVQQLRVLQKNPQIFAFASLPQGNRAEQNRNIVRKLHRAKFGERFLCSYIAEQQSSTQKVTKRQSTTGKLSKLMAKLSI